MQPATVCNTYAACRCNVSGSNVCHISRIPPRVRSLTVCRDNTARFHIMRTAVNGDLCTLRRRQWQLEQLSITPAAPRD
jgi:hypothetical protein